MSENGPHGDDEEDDGDRRVNNIVIVVFLAVIVGAGVWLVNALLEQRRIDDCLAQGRRNCAPIEAPRRQ